MSADIALNLCVLISTLCWGAWGIFDKISLRYASSVFVAAALFAFSIPAGALTFVLLNIYDPGWGLTPEIFFWTGLGFASYAIAMVCYLSALNISEASYVLGATASYPIILQFLSNWFLGESLVPARIFGSLLVAAGVTAIGVSVTEQQKRELGSDKKRLLFGLVIAATLLWGIWGIFDKKAVEAGGPLAAFLAHCIFEFVALLPLGVLIWRKHRQYFGAGAKLWLPLSASAICINFGGLSYMLALSMATASYVIVITGCYPLIMYLLALLILKERFNYIRLIGIALVTIGGIVTHTTAGL